MKLNTEQYFQCACCGGTFKKGCTDEEMIEAFKRQLPDVGLDFEELIKDSIRVCEDCYKEQAQ